VVYDDLEIPIGMNCRFGFWNKVSTGFCDSQGFCYEVNGKTGYIINGILNVRETRQYIVI
jgi:hypothetical protein